jgi:hypothetical protein
VLAGSANRITEQYEKDQTYEYISRHFCVGKLNLEASSSWQTYLLRLFVMVMLLRISEQHGSCEQHAKMSLGENNIWFLPVTFMSLGFKINLYI